jgi:protein phosphatase
VNARLHVSGGALGGGRMVEDASSVAGVSLGLLPWNHVFHVCVPVSPG